ncbi:HAMP domain-containing protein, partial [Streptomyces cinnamoneus]|uniref:HAMP domain-containing protein n=1 Tax=Streptomyces cinnamoneus TaxID=53446 RepID=UPI001EFC5B83
RTKIGVAITATAALVAVLIGLVVHHRTADTQLDLAREALDQRLVTAAEDHAAGVHRPRLILNPARLPAPLRQAVDKGRRATYLDRSGPEPTLWAATRSGADTVVLKHSYPSGPRTRGAGPHPLAGRRPRHRLRRARRRRPGGPSRRLNASARIAERIADGDLTARLTPRGGRDEVARLTHAVNTMADALAARLQAEREVTANISHELRTPVAGLVAAAGLLPPGRPAEMVRERAGRVHALLEDVLEVARLDGDAERAEPEVRELGALTRRAVRAARVPGQRPVEVRVLRDCLVETDARRVERILANLVTTPSGTARLPSSSRSTGGPYGSATGGRAFPSRCCRAGRSASARARFRPRPGSDDRGGPGEGAGRPPRLRQPRRRRGHARPRPRRAGTRPRGPGGRRLTCGGGEQAQEWMP